MAEKLKSEDVQKRAVFYVHVILRAITAGRCGERRYSDHIFIQIYLRMYHFVVRFSKFSFSSGSKGALTPLTKILRTFLLECYCRVAGLSIRIVGSSRDPSRLNRMVDRERERDFVRGLMYRSVEFLPRDAMHPRH